jgi:hypothetical protein
VFGEIAFNQVSHGWSDAALVSNGERINALINVALDTFGLFARSNRAPVRKIADEQPPAAWSPMGLILSTSTGRGHLRRSHPQGREAGRPAGAGADQIRAGDQSENR